MFLGVGKKKQHLVVVSGFGNFWFPSLVKNRNSFGYFRVVHPDWSGLTRFFSQKLGPSVGPRCYWRFSYQSCSSEWFVTVFHDFKEAGSLFLNCFFQVSTLPFVDWSSKSISGSFWRQVWQWPRFTNDARKQWTKTSCLALNWNTSDQPKFSQSGSRREGLQGTTARGMSTTQSSYI